VIGARQAISTGTQKLRESIDAAVAMVDQVLMQPDSAELEWRLNLKDSEKIQTFVNGAALTRNSLCLDPAYAPLFKLSSFLLGQFLLSLLAESNLYLQVVIVFEQAYVSSTEWCCSWSRPRRYSLCCTNLLII
jgi:hypothetical protein